MSESRIDLREVNKARVNERVNRPFKSSRNNLSNDKVVYDGSVIAVIGSVFHHIGYVGKAVSHINYQCRLVSYLLYSFISE